MEMMAERGPSIAHTTSRRRAQHSAPEFEFWRRFARPVGRSSRVEETFIKIRGEWYDVYVAVDRAGRTVDYSLGAHHDVASAKAFARRSGVLARLN